MAIEKVINVDVNADGVEELNKSLETSNSSVETLETSFMSLNEEIDDTGKKGSDSLGKVEKGGKDASKSVGGIGTAFRAVGAAIKAAGIGLVIAAFAQIKELLEQNQKVLDFFNTTFNVTSIAFNDFVNFIGDNWESGTEAVSDFFEPENIEKTGQAIAEGIVNRFKQLIEATKILGSAFTKLFQGDFSGALDTAKEGLVELVDVVTGEDGGLEAVTDFFVGAGEAIADYVSETVEAGQEITRLNNLVEINAAKQQGIIEEFDRLAERQRQIRDDERLSIEERIAANDELGRILEEQTKAELELAEVRVRQAQIQVGINDNVENQIALIEAENEVKAINARITGFQSEQLVNQNALLKEQEELRATAEQGENERRIAESQFQAERIEDEVKRIEALQESLELEREIEEERLQNNIKLYKEGTQARVDAEQEYLNFVQDANQREQELNDDLDEAKNKSSEEEKARDKAVGEQKVAVADQTLGVISGLVDENSKLGKAAGIAQATINTYQGVTGVWTSPYDPATPFPIQLAAKIAGTATVLASGLQAVRQIAQTTLPSGGGGGGGGSFGGASVAQLAPQFNVVGQGGANQIAEVLGDQPPVKAYVVGSDVTSQQALDRNAINTATFG